MSEMADDETVSSKDEEILTNNQPEGEEDKTVDEEVDVDSDNEDFHDADDDQVDYYFIDEKLIQEKQANFNDEQKQEKLEEAQKLKQDGNVLFKQEEYSEAIELYTKALRCCPLEFNKDRSILYSNRSACFFKLKENEKCISDCTKSIEFDPTFIKPILRRAECYELTEKLDESLVDYKKLSELEPRNIAYIKKINDLQQTINERNEKLKTEMMGKLKELGNMVLKPFGLSTDNFNFVQDPNTGSYSVNFQNK